MSTPMSAAVLDRFRSGKVTAVLRGSSTEHFAAVAEVLVEAGIDLLEVTLTTPQALESLQELASKFEGTATVGAGSVIEEPQAQAAIAAGAAFLVSPTTSLPVLRAGQAASVPVVPGAFTPSEFATARAAGAELVKLFPAGVVGPAYLRHLRGPFPDLEAMPTGGIALDQISEWLRAGAAAVGVGGPLLGDALSGGSLAELARRATHAVSQAGRLVNGS